MNDTNHITTFLKPEKLAPISNLSLRAKLIVEGMIAGLHKSPYHGFSAEFSEYRLYRQGESTRLVDWRKFAKTDKTVVRLFEDETNLFAHILLDKSGSMGFRFQGPMTKYDYAATLCASIAWILVRQRDAVGFAAFDEKISRFMPPRSTNIQLKTIIAEIDRLRPGESTQCGAAIDWLAGIIKKRGMCVIVSDLFDDPRRIIQGLKHLRFKKQDVIVLWLMDPLERNFSRKTPLRIIDAESGEHIDLDPRIAARYFHENLEEHRRIIEKACRDMSIDLHAVTTDEPFERALQRVVQRRMLLF